MEYSWVLVGSQLGLSWVLELGLVGLLVWWKVASREAASMEFASRGGGGCFFVSVLSAPKLCWNW